jgi:hypothetical protein
MPAKYVRPYSKGQKNDFNDAEAIAEAVQRPTMKFVATKTVEQLDLQALHRVRERLVSQRTGIINQIRAFMLERGIAVRQGVGFLRTELPTILATRTDALSPRMLRVIEELAGDWRRLDQRCRTPSSVCEDGESPEGKNEKTGLLAGAELGCDGNTKPSFKMLAAAEPWGEGAGLFAEAPPNTPNARCGGALVAVTKILAISVSVSGPPLPVPPPSLLVIVR